MGSWWNRMGPDGKMVWRPAGASYDVPLRAAGYQADMHFGRSGVGLMWLRVILSRDHVALPELAPGAAGDLVVFLDRMRHTYRDCRVLRSHVDPVFWGAEMWFARVGGLAESEPQGATGGKAMGEAVKPGERGPIGPPEVVAVDASGLMHYNALADVLAWVHHGGPDHGAEYIVPTGYTVAVDSEPELAAGLVAGARFYPTSPEAPEESPRKGCTCPKEVWLYQGCKCGGV